MFNINQGKKNRPTASNTVIYNMMMAMAYLAGVDPKKLIEIALPTDGSPDKGFARFMLEIGGTAVKQGTDMFPDSSRIRKGARRLKGRTKEMEELLDELDELDGKEPS